MKAVIVTGTPGTGKTHLAKRLSKACRMQYVDVSKVINRHRLCEGRDVLRGCDIVDSRKLSGILTRLIRDSKRRLIIDSHLSHYIHPRYVELCIVTRCSLRTLKKRLMKRGYPSVKVRENLDAEIFEICLVEAEERGHKVLVVDTDVTPDLKSIRENFK
jgi:adenylate kinase